MVLEFITIFNLLWFLGFIFLLAYGNQVRTGSTTQVQVYNPKSFRRMAQIFELRVEIQAKLMTEQTSLGFNVCLNVRHSPTAQVS